MKKLLFVFGTRPETIKMAPLVIEFKKHKKHFKTLICVTGQHREMLDQVLLLFKITPDFDLNIMKENQDLYYITSSILLGMRTVLRKVKPDLVFVQGDTTTSTATALAAFYQQIPVAHVEAGLRTYNNYSPWPEEMNRQLTGRIASYHFAPTTTAKNNLILENVAERKICVTGNTGIDSLQIITERFRLNKKIEPKTIEILKSFGYDVNRLDSRRLILITGHRRENFGDGFINICKAIKKLAETFTDVDFVYPVHLNPNVRKFVLKLLDSKSENRNIFLINPLAYLPFVFLMNKAYLLLTDSGGIQEEAPSLGKPVIVMRDITERPEAVDAGGVVLVGTNYKKIINAVSLLLNSSEKYKSMSKAQNPYGDGTASKKIVQFLKNKI